MPSVCVGKQDADVTEERQTIVYADRGNRPRLRDAYKSKRER